MKVSSDLGSAPPPPSNTQVLTTYLHNGQLQCIRETPIIAIGQKVHLHFIIVKVKVMLQGYSVPLMSSTQWSHY